MQHKDTGINPYGSYNRVEFFAVISEYFFERPELLAAKHPELYKHLRRMFKQDMRDFFRKKTFRTIRRNDPCPCGSGKKFKQC